MKARLYFCAVMLTTAACKNYKVITSTPPGAVVYIDGKQKGVTPYRYENHSPFWTKNTVELTKPGYQKSRETISRAETVNPGGLVAGLFFFPCLLWAGGFHSDLHVNLRQQADTTQMLVQSAEPPVKKTKAEKIAVVERLYDQGAMTRKEYLAELKWIEESEDDKNP
jgi:hypothetical protein